MLWTERHLHAPVNAFVRKGSRSLPDSEGSGTGWQRITPENFARLRVVLVTNNPSQRGANDGRMSHLWLVQMVFMDRVTGEFSAFDDSDRRICGLTHYYEAPNADLAQRPDAGVSDA